MLKIVFLLTLVAMTAARNWESDVFEVTKYVPVIGFGHGLVRSVGYAIAGDDRETTRSATGMLQNLSTTGMAVAGGVFGGPAGAVIGGTVGASMTWGIEEINRTYDDLRDRNSAHGQQG